MTSAPMSRPTYQASFSENAAENYEKYFVPVIGGPFARDLVNEAGLRAGETVLDVACGTGTIARLAAARVVPRGAVSALDVTPAMLAVARSLPSELPIKWYETAAESVPLPDNSFDVLFSGLALQFFTDKPAALREMHRVLKPGGRLYISTPMPNAFFDVLDRAIAKHVSEEASTFVHAVFSLNDPDELSALLAGAGFAGIASRPHQKKLQLPSATDFMWQYIYCTPLMSVLPRSGNAQTEALEREVATGWKRWATHDGMAVEQSVLFGSAHRK